MFQISRKCSLHASCLPPPYRGSVPCLTQNGAKSAEKIPALIVFGRIRSSNVNQSAVFIKKDAEAAKKAALDAGLSSFEVTTEEHQRAAAALPEGAIIAQQLARGETLTAEAVVFMIVGGFGFGLLLQLSLTCSGLALPAGARLQVRLSVNAHRSWFRFWGGGSGCDGRLGQSEEGTTNAD